VNDWIEFNSSVSIILCGIIQRVLMGAKPIYLLLSF